MNRLNELMKKMSTIIGITQDCVGQAADVRMLRKMNAIMNNDMYPLHVLEVFQQSTFSGRLIPPKCKTERYRKSLLPAAIRLFNEQ